MLETMLEDIIGGEYNAHRPTGRAQYFIFQRDPFGGPLGGGEWADGAGPTKPVKRLDEYDMNAPVQRPNEWESQNPTQRLPDATPAPMKSLSRVEKGQASLNH